MRLCFYVIRAFLPSLPGGRRYADLGIKSPPDLADAVLGVALPFLLYGRPGDRVDRQTRYTSQPAEKHDAPDIV